GFLNCSLYSSTRVIPAIISFVVSIKFTSTIPTKLLNVCFAYERLTFCRRRQLNRFSCTVLKSPASPDSNEFLDIMPAQSKFRFAGSFAEHFVAVFIYFVPAVIK